MAEQPQIVDFPIKPKRAGWPHLVAAVALILLAVMSVLFWLELSRKFPNIAAGSYLGSIEGRALGIEDAPSVGLYIEKSPVSGYMNVAVLAPGWNAQSVNLPAGPDENSSLVPLSISGPDSRLIFSGQLTTAGTYKGEVEDQLTHRRGKWEVAPLDRTSHGKDQELALWTSLSAELAEVEAEIAHNEKLVPEQRAEIESLTGVISESEKFKNKAGERYQAYRKELQQLQASLEEKKKAAAKLEAAFEVSRRVTGMGRLILQARESLEREWRWVDSMLRFGDTSSSAELDAAVERAERISQVKQAIGEERQKIDAILGQEAVNP